MKDLFSVDFRDAIRKVVKRELKEKFGIKTNKDKGKTGNPTECSSKYFGIPLEDVPSKSVKDEEYFKVPIFLIESFEYLNGHVKVEGLFRKSGSVGRQKVLREILEKDGTCCSCEFVQPHDVAALVKQFFRELPDPLLTRRLCPTFLKCISLSNQNDCISATALCCLLLPDEHLRVLTYFVKFIAEMANHSLESKMTLSNLAIIFAPNLTSSSAKDKSGEKSMKECTQVIDLIFKNSHLIGMVPDVLFNKAMTMNQEGGFCSSSGDELDAPDDRGRGRTLQRSDKKRDRSKSITGFLRRNFKTNEKGSSSNSAAIGGKHVRSRTCEKPRSNKVAENHLDIPSRTCDKPRRKHSDEHLHVPSRSTSIKEFGEPIWKKMDTERAIKRRTNSKTNMSPVRKSPRILSKEVEMKQNQPTPPVISLPKLKSLPNQIASTPRRLLQPIHNQEQTKTPLPSKFEIPSRRSTDKGAKTEKVHQHRSQTVESHSKQRLSRSQSSILHHTSSSKSPLTKHGNKISPQHTTTNDESPTTVQQQPTRQLPQSKLSRATQKPHVRKTRRASSLDRRRARYASTSQRIRRQLPKVPNEKSLNESTISNVSFSCNDISESLEEIENVAFLASRNAPQASFQTREDVNKLRVKRRLPKASSTTSCSPATRKENKNPVTPENRRIQRSNTSIRKPATPYSVTPQVGTRRNPQALNFIGNRKPLVL